MLEEGRHEQGERSKELADNFQSSGGLRAGEQCEKTAT